MMRLSDLQQITKVDESAAASPEAQALPSLAHLKTMPASDHLIGAERCDSASPPRATAGQSPCF